MQHLQLPCAHIPNPSPSSRPSPLNTHIASMPPSSRLQVDRSPKHFEHILDFLRSGQVALPASLANLEQLHVEAEFFALDDLAERVRQKLRRCRMVRWASAVLGKQALPLGCPLGAQPDPNAAALLHTHAVQ